MTHILGYPMTTESAEAECVVGTVSVPSVEFVEPDMKGDGTEEFDSSEITQAAADMYSRASSLLGAAQGAIALIKGVVIPPFNPAGVTIPTASINYNTVGSPSVDVNLSAVDPEAYNPEKDFELPDAEIEAPPPFSITKPDLDFSGEPDELPLIDIGDVPDIDDVTVPGPPGLTFPDDPVLSEITIPDIPIPEMPIFEGVSPAFDAPPPAPLSYNEGAYASTLSDTLVDKLVADILSSSSGIDPDVEQALYDRAVNRFDIEAQKQQQDTENYFASKGYFLPPGAMSARIVELQNGSVRARGDILNDILVQRSNLVQQNIQALLTGGVQMEGLLRQSFDNTWNRHLEYSKAVAENAMALYNALVEKYKADMQGYNTEAEVFRSRVQAETARMEAYKTRLEGAKVTAEVQELVVKVYTARMDAIKTRVDVYLAEMEGAKIHAEVNNLRLGVFKAKVDAYSAIVQANLGRWQGYGTKVQAQGVKASAYGEEVKAYGAQVQAYGTITGARIDNAKLQTDFNNSSISLYNGYTQRYAQDIQKKLGTINAEIAAVAEEVKAEGINAELAAKHAETQVRMAGVDVEGIKAQIENHVQNSRVNMTAAVEAAKATSEAMRAKAQALAQLGAAAMGTINNNMGMSYNMSNSKSASRSIGMTSSHSVSHSQSLSNSLSSNCNTNRGTVQNQNISWVDSHSMSENENTNTSTGTNTNTNVSQSVNQNFSTGTNTNVNTSRSTNTNTNNSTSNNTNTSTGTNTNTNTSTSTNTNTSTSTSTNTNTGTNTSTTFNTNSSNSTGYTRMFNDSFVRSYNDSLGTSQNYNYFP